MYTAAEIRTQRHNAKFGLNAQGETLVTYGWTDGRNGIQVQNIGSTRNLQTSMGAISRFTVIEIGQVRNPRWSP